MPLRLRPLSRHQDALFTAVLREIAGRLPAGARLYDVGGGIGYFSELALAAGFDAHNVELSEVACAKARERIGALLVHTSLTGMAPADVITLWCVIGHTPDPAAFLDDVAAALRPGGWVFVTTPKWRFQALLARVLSLRATALLASRGFAAPTFGAWGVKERCVALGDSSARPAVLAKRLWNRGWSWLGGGLLPVDLTSEFQVLVRYQP